MPVSDIGTGTLMTFGTSSFSARIESVDGPSMHRDAIETTHMATTSNKTFMPGDLVDRGEINITFHHDASLTPPIASAAETVTITWPIPSGLTNGATWAASCFMTDYSPTSEIEGLMTAKATLKVSGAITIVAAS